MYIKIQKDSLVIKGKMEDILNYLRLASTKYIYVKELINDRIMQ